MEDRRITPSSNDPSASGGGVYQPQPVAQRLLAVGADDPDDEDNNRSLDEEFPLEGGVEPAQRAVPPLFPSNANQQQSAAKTSSRRSHAPASALENGEGVLPQPNNGVDPEDDGKSYGEMGKPVVLPANLTAEIKNLVEEGWKNNAFNQYASDLISVHRSLPDPRDEW